MTFPVQLGKKLLWAIALAMTAPRSFKVIFNIFAFFAPLRYEILYYSGDSLTRNKP